MRRVDTLIGGMAVAFAAFALTQSTALDFFQRSDIPGPGFFPTLLAIAIGVIGLLLVATRLVGAPDRFGPFASPSRGELRRSLTVWLAFLISVALLDVVGFVVASAGLIAVLLLGVEKLRSPGALLTVVLLPVVSYVVFVLLLRVELPIGPWGF